MSNYLAIAAVTSTIKFILQAVFDTEMNSAKATSVRPSAPAAELPNPGVNVYLYQVTPNPAFRSTDLPTRRADGSLLQRPRVALDLHYLLTYHGADKDYEPQMVMGLVARTLHAHPVLSSADIAAAIAADPATSVADSDLPDQLEAVRLVPAALSLEETSKLWSVMLQTPYFLSMAFQANVVLIEAPAVIPAPLPVRTAQVVAFPILRPTIDRVLVEGPSGEPVSGPIRPTSKLVITGTELKGDDTSVLFGGQPAAPTSAGFSEVRLPVPSSLLAGVQSLQISQKVFYREKTSDAPVLIQGAESAAASFVLHPTFTAGHTGKKIHLTNVTPAVGSKQRVVVYLTEKPSSPIPAGFKPRSFTFLLPKGTSGASIDVDATAAPAGVPFLVRVQVDGAESVLDVDANGMFSGPTVTL